jgi:SAM-dependent methyltransferase
MRLNVGAGSRPIVGPGWVNLDRVKLHGIDIVWDLDAGPWPFENGSGSQIEAKDVFEHVADPILFMTECYRILRPHGVLHIRTPHFTCIDAFTDPTHRRQCTEHTFDYWIPGTIYFREHNAAYGGAQFHLAKLEMDNGTMDVRLARADSGDTGT